MVSETMTQAESEESHNTIEIDGIVIDADTGEVISALHYDNTSAPFAVTDEESLEWFLRRVQAIDARIKALDESYDVQAARAVLAREDVTQAQAILANLGAMKARLQSARDGLLRWQDAPLRATASALLAERLEKGRTLRTLFGAVSLKRIAARWRVAEGVETRATWNGIGHEAPPDVAKWAIAFGQADAVKTTVEFQISKLQKDADRPDEFFSLEPERETVSVETGVGLHVE